MAIIVASPAMQQTLMQEGSATEFQCEDDGDVMSKKLRKVNVMNIVISAEAAMQPRQEP